MDAATFFARLNALMKDNPPAAADADAMKRFAAIGVAPGKPFDPAKLDPAVAKGVERGVRAAREKIVAEAKKPPGKTVNDWSVVTDKNRPIRDGLPVPIDRRPGRARRQPARGCHLPDHASGRRGQSH